MKPVFFVGTARKDLAEFPESARRRAGHERFMVQMGREPSDCKPLQRIGPGAFEIRVRDEVGTFRVIYVAKLEHAVYVLHAFQKKTRKTSQSDIALAAKRYHSIDEAL